MKYVRVPINIRPVILAVLIVVAILFAGYIPAINTAEAQSDILLERRLSQIEQRFYTLESRLSRIEQAPSALPQSPSLNRSDVEISNLRALLDAQRLQMEALRMRADDLECGLARVDERTLTPAAREARRRTSPDGTEQCRADPNTPVKLMARER
jgi:hypothetical protein